MLKGERDVYVMYEISGRGISLYRSLMYKRCEYTRGIKKVNASSWEE